MLDELAEEEAVEVLDFMDYLRWRREEMDQSWFWTEEWQTRYQEAKADLAERRYRDFDDVEDLLADLAHYTVNFVLLLAYAERRGIRTEWRALLSQLRDRTALPVWVDGPGDAGRQAKAIEAIVAGARGEMER